MSKPRKPRKEARPRRSKPGDRRSPWNYLAPAALLGAVTVITLILSSAGVLGHGSDGDPPVTSPPAVPVETLSVPESAPPPEPPPPQPAPPEPAPPPPPATTTATTSATTTTTEEETTEQPPATTAGDGQHVKWTVRKGDTLGSIARQFGTTVKELQVLNPAIDPDALQIGQELVVG